jgi:hypothetical protein
MLQESVAYDKDAALSVGGRPLQLSIVQSYQKIDFFHTFSLAD